MGGKNRRMMRPGLRASLHEMRRDGVVERRMAEGCGVENVPAQAAIARGRFDEIEPSRGRLPPPSSSQHSANRSASSVPKTGPTSTLVKKSPARPDRWAARA